MRREEHKKATRQRLLETALALFREKGFEATTVAEVTERAGVAKGTFFNYFASKEDVLLELSGGQQDWGVAALGQLLEARGPLRPQLQRVMVRLAERLTLSRELVRAFISSAATAPGRLPSYRAHQEGVAEALARVLAEGEARGEWRCLAPPEVLADLAMQTYFGALLWWCAREDAETLGERVARSFEVFLAGALGPAKAPRGKAPPSATGRTASTRRRKSRS